MERYIMKSIVVHLGNLPIELSSTGVYTLICLMWVSLPFWWLARTAIWIINVRIGFLWGSVKGTWIQPLGSTNSSCCQKQDKKAKYSGTVNIHNVNDHMIFIDIKPNTEESCRSDFSYFLKSIWSNRVENSQLIYCWRNWIKKHLTTVVSAFTSQNLPFILHLRLKIKNEYKNRLEYKIKSKHYYLYLANKVHYSKMTKMCIFKLFEPLSTHPDIKYARMT